jgi:hypothetical protein
MLCKGFLVAAGTKAPGQKTTLYSIRVPKTSFGSPVPLVPGFLF